MKIGLIGFGSVGRRHVANLLSLGFKNITLFREKARGNESGLQEEYDYETFIKKDLDFIIISNPTTDHFKKLVPLIHLGRNILVEKPLVNNEEECRELLKILRDYAGKGMVAYNMRFHPCITRIAQLCDEDRLGKAFSARFFVGQYLPDWRPGQDYRTGVSALKKLGGGVILELIHEIDMAILLFGKPASGICSVAGKLSSLETETEDISEILYRSEKNVIISIHQDYLNRDYRRIIEIVGQKGTLYCDLKTSEIKITGPGGDVLLDEKINFERNDMYLALMKYYTGCISGDSFPKPDLSESLESVWVALEAKKKNNL